MPAIRIAKMVYKIVLCVPILFRMSIVLITVLYVYALIGMTLFSKDKQNDVYSPFDYKVIHFESLTCSILTLIQVICNSQWMNLIYHYQIKMGNLVVVAIYFNSLFFISNLIVLGLIKGLILEVFLEMEWYMSDSDQQQQQQVQEQNGL